MNTFDSALLDALLMKPRKILRSATIGHLPFFMWFTKLTKPRILVELGSHNGNSYLAFCQAVEENNLDTKCYAVDTWQGDGQTGLYGEEVYQEFSNYHNNLYGSFSRLLRMSFDDAVTHFADGSIDLMHIDGLHTYEAVRHDFETWMPKMSASGIVLFHDTNVREVEFGVWKFWEELRTSFPSMDFSHSSGLGVLFVGNNYNERIQWVVQNMLDYDNCLSIINFFSGLGSETSRQYKMQCLEQTVTELSRSMAEREAELVKVRRSLSEHLNHSEALKQTMSEIYQSRSWKITAPYRYLGNRLQDFQKLSSQVLYGLKTHGGFSQFAKKTFRVLQHEGLGGIKRRIKNVREGYRYFKRLRNYDRNDYKKWSRQYCTLTDHDHEVIKRNIQQLEFHPLISIVMPVYNTPTEFVDAAIWSVRKQLYQDWELCIADDNSANQLIRDLIIKHGKEDKRIKWRFRESNGHISAASNSALELAKGEFVGFLDHDDTLSEDALYHVVQSINANPNVKILYSDEDKVCEKGNYFDPHFKSDWNPELLFSHNYVCHFVVYRLDVVRNAGGFRVGFEGSQDHDLILRVMKHVSTKDITHIPKILYHWRALPGSTALASQQKDYASEAGLKALQEHFDHVDGNAHVEMGPVPNSYRVRYPIPNPCPLVTIIIPTCDKLNLLQNCLNSILDKTIYPNFEIIVVNNRSQQNETISYLHLVQEIHKNFEVINYDHEFNYSAINNLAVKRSNGEILALVNNDVEVINPEWLSEMVSHACRPEIGCVGAKLCYADGTVQHGGVILGIGGVAGHSHKHFHREANGYFSRLKLTQNLSVVTAACLVVRKEVYEKVGGFDEQNLKVAFNDVDFCLKVREAGFNNLWTPFAELYHLESESRGGEDNREKQERFATEVQCMTSRWGQKLLNDPYYNPNLTLDAEDFSLAWPPRNK